MALFLSLALLLWLPFPASADEPTTPPPTGPTINTGLGSAPTEIDRTTPRRSWRGFIEAAAKKDLLLAAHFLDLREVDPAQQPLVGPDRAGEIYRLIRGLGPPRIRSIPDETDPPLPAKEEPGTWILKAFEHGASGVHGKIMLQRQILPETNQPVWLISSETVSAVTAWYSRIVEGQKLKKPTHTLNAGLEHPTSGLDRSTPARSLRNYVDACRAGDFALAAHSLRLDHLPVQRQAELGPRLARKLKLVLDQKLWIDFDLVSDQPHGKPEAAEIPHDEDEIGTIRLRNKEIPIRMVRVPLGGEEAAWVFSKGTVVRISDLYREFGLDWWGDYIPDSLFGHRFLELDLWQWMGLAVSLIIALILATAAQWLGLYILDVLATRAKISLLAHFVDRATGPVRALFFLVLLRIFLGQLRPAQPVEPILGQIFFPLFVLTIAWLVMRLVAASTHALDEALGQSQEGASYRASSTRILLLRRVLNFLVTLCATALVLMQFEIVRNVGTGLLASAGIAGLVLGLAAQKTIGNIFAGIQLGLTQPLKLGDFIKIDGTTGTVEEISLSHVIIRVWDKRRFVVPIPTLLSKPIENWTRVSPDLLGTVYLVADYRVDVEAARRRAVEIVEASPLWDRAASPSLIVTDLKEGSVQLRVLTSAKDAGDLWSLRCQVREQMLLWLQEHDFTPKHPVMVQEAGGDPEQFAPNRETGCDTHSGQ